MVSYYPISNKKKKVSIQNLAENKHITNWNSETTRVFFLVLSSYGCQPKREIIKYPLSNTQIIRIQFVDYLYLAKKMQIIYISRILPISHSIPYLHIIESRLSIAAWILKILLHIFKIWIQIGESPASLSPLWCISPDGAA